MACEITVGNITVINCKSVTAVLLLLSSRLLLTPLSHIAIHYYPRRQLVGIGRMFESVCLFVRSITQKRKNPKVFKLGIGPWDILEIVWFWWFGD